MTESKKTWETPVLIALDLDLESVHNGFLAGTDGGTGLSATSLS